VYKCLHETALSHLANQLQCKADFEFRSTASLSLAIGRTWLTTVSDRAFPVAAAHT